MSESTVKPRVFRMLFVPDSDMDLDECRAKLFEEFNNEEHQFIGTGWADTPLRAGMSDDEIARLPAVTDHESPQARANYRRMFANLCGVRPGDLIWMNHASHMHLFRVTENCIGREDEQPWFKSEKEQYKSMDIGHIFLGEWVEVRTSSVPGVVINRMGIGTTFEEVKACPELSYNAWNKWACEGKENAYEIGDLSSRQGEIWNALTNRQVEGLVLSYLQVDKNCCVLTETIKHNTKGYECVLVDKQGMRYYPQVKTGNAEDAAKIVSDLETAMKEDEGDPAKKKAVVFFEKENYGGVPDRIEKIYREKLISFACANGRLLRQNVRETFELFGYEVKG